MPAAAPPFVSSGSSPLLALPAAAQYLTLGLRTLKVLVAKGAIPVVRVAPRRVAIRVADLDAYISARRSQ